MHLSPETDVNYFQLPGYTMVNDFARLNKCGGIAIYVHSSFSLKRLDTSEFMQNSTVYEAIFLEIYNNNYKYKKYIVGSLYRRPSQLLTDITQFTEEFSETLAKIHANCKQSYINEDYNIDLLQMHRNNYFDSFYENITSQGFFPKLTRLTRSYDNTHTLIDNVLTNNICKPHISGILTYHVSDHFMFFCVVEGKVMRVKDTPKYIEVENITSLSISNFKGAIGNSDILSKFDLDPQADPNINYNLLSSTINKNYLILFFIVIFYCFFFTLLFVHSFISCVFVVDFFSCENKFSQKKSLHIPKNPKKLTNVSIKESHG